MRRRAPERLQQSKVAERGDQGVVATLGLFPHAREGGASRGAHRVAPRGRRAAGAAAARGREEWACGDGIGAALDAVAAEDHEAPDQDTKEHRAERAEGGGEDDGAVGGHATVRKGKIVVSISLA